jgi:hypothetical protein
MPNLAETATGAIRLGEGEGVVHVEGDAESRARTAHPRAAGRRGVGAVDALNRLRAMVSLAQYSPPIPRPTGDRGWMA